MSEIVLVEVSCSFCGESASVQVVLDGWRVRYGSISDENAFCPKHAQVEDFFQDQCPGCVAGWPDCPLYRAFAYSRNRDMSEADFAALRRGVCPKRVNGSFTVTNGGGKVSVEDVNISDVSQSGAAIESAIRDYIATYPDEARP